MEYLKKTHTHTHTVRGIAYNKCACDEIIIIIYTTVHRLFCLLKNATRYDFDNYRRCYVDIYIHICCCCHVHGLRYADLHNACLCREKYMGEKNRATCTLRKNKVIYSRNDDGKNMCKTSAFTLLSFIVEII